MVSPINSHILKVYLYIPKYLIIITDGRECTINILPEGRKKIRRHYVSDYYFSFSHETNFACLINARRNVFGDGVRVEVAVGSESIIYNLRIDCTRFIIRLRVIIILL